ncbi:BPSL0761 family protein [Paraburkholderia lycopersici]|uniref:BPSL0761 family protein n=1 Tax=Paraburkholderia lycopersici TaxID=416944 RepID=UPI0031843FB1
MPYERTKAVIETRELLQMLAAGGDITIGKPVQMEALCLLRHYPHDIDLDVSAAALPRIWGAPKHRRLGSAAASKFRSGTPGRGNADDIRGHGEEDSETASGS